ncbi:multidrug effflux MFS transporter [Marinobacterium stanieri]|uniref:Bcr/CflA family efflux transporter n=1 Tax=Marinobacterium stanieri TaxID=49186 RepID=A0A1N6NN46_9GAMM|nr:multidrug effflux MFS transporter [Marinobacterium stanieri]SIP93490.1 MFS transporter, DHA1 family, bicyclomycin/chloramphenicol resistance protein [Marinobacterium stanieri]
MKTTPALPLLVAIAMASPLALNAFVPAMPDAARALNADISTIQLTFTAYLLTLAFGQLISGPLADYFGRRPVLLVGLGLHVAGSCLAASADGVMLLVAGRVLQALGGSTAMVLARTIILDVHGRAGAAGRMGYVVMAIAIAQSIAPALGGYINLWGGWNAIFYLSILMGGLVWLLALRLLPETCAERSDNLRLGRVLRSYGGVLGSGQYLGYALSTTFIATAFYLFVGSAPYIVVDQLGGDSADFGTWFLAVSLAFMLGSFCSTRLASRFNVDQMVLLGNGLSLLGAAALVVLAWWEALSFASLFLPMALVTFGRGLSQPNAQSAAISCAPGAAATASGLMGFIQLLTGAAIAQLVPSLMQLGLTTLFSCILLAPLLALAAHWHARQKAEVTA